MRRYQEAGMEVARTPLDQAEAQLTEARRQHDAILEDSPEAQVNKEVLAYKISLLEAKHKEHLAIQERLLEAHQAGADEVSRSPDYALRNQMQLFDELQRQMDVDAEVLRIPAEQIPKRLEEIRALREKADQERKRMGDVRSEGPEVQLQALRLDQTIAKFDNQLRMLTSLQETLGRFVEIGRGEAGQGLIGLQRVAGEALEAAQAELDRLNLPEGIEGRAEAIALQGEKVRGLEAQVESLRVAVESYQAHAATQVTSDARFLQKLMDIVPESVSIEQKDAYLIQALRAIVAIQQTLAPEFGDEEVRHDKIQGLLQQIYKWNQQYLGIMGGSIEAVRRGVAIDGPIIGHIRYTLPQILQAIAGYMHMLPANVVQEIDARRAAIRQIEEEYAPLDAVRDHTRDVRAISANRARFATENILLNTLLAIQGVHQPLLGAHAAEKAELEWQKSALGTMQRMIVGFFSMLFSIPGVLIGGLQTMGHPIIGNPNH